jgi:tetratricopeptide (TPR) repeat protein
MYAEVGKHLDEAKAHVLKALAQDPNNGAYLDSMGWVYYKKGDLPHALEYLKKAAELERDAVIAEHLGDVYVKLGQKDLALERYEEAVKIDRENASAPRKIGLLKAGKDPLVGEK